MHVSEVPVVLGPTQWSTFAGDFQGMLVYGTSDWLRWILQNWGRSIVNGARKLPRSTWY